MDVTQRALAAYPETWKIFAGPEFPASEEDGILLVATGGKATYCNQLIVISEPADPVAALEAGIHSLDERDLPFLVQVPDGSAVHAATSRFGLKPTDPTPFMTLSPINDSGWRRPPPELEIVKARTEADARRVEAILAAAFQMDPVAVRTFAFERFLDSPTVRCFLGWVDGEAVTTATSAWVDGVAGVFSVGTLENQRGKGLGEVVTGHAIRAAVEEGADMAFLQASPMGYPIYERMGFKTVTTHTMYMRA